jgi:hypothetical protein
MTPGTYYLKSLTVITTEQEITIGISGGSLSVVESGVGHKRWYVDIDGLEEDWEIFDALFESDDIFEIRALTDDGITLKGKVLIKELNISSSGTYALLTGTGPLIKSS